MPDIRESTIRRGSQGATAVARVGSSLCVAWSSSPTEGPSGLAVIDLESMEERYQPTSMAVMTQLAAVGTRLFAAQFDALVEWPDVSRLGPPKVHDLYPYRLDADGEELFLATSSGTVARYEGGSQIDHIGGVRKKLLGLTVGFGRAYAAYDDGKVRAWSYWDPPVEPAQVILDVGRVPSCVLATDGTLWTATYAGEVVRRRRDTLEELGRTHLTFPDGVLHLHAAPRGRVVVWGTEDMRVLSPELDVLAERTFRTGIYDLVLDDVGLFVATGRDGLLIGPPPP